MTAILAWGACPDPLVAQAILPQVLPPPKPGENPFARFRKLDPDPVALLPAERAWFVSVPFAPIGGGAMDAERVYVPLREEWLFALDRETGALSWSREIEAATAPVVSDGKLFVVSRSQVRAFDAATGEDVWAVPLPARVSAPLAVAAGSLVATVDPGIAIVFRTTDGEETWRRSLGAPSQYAPVFGGRNAVYFSLSDGRVVALDSADGSLRWQQMLPGMVSEPTVAPDRVVIGSTDNFFYALDADSGKLEWKWRGGGDVIGSAYDGKLLYFASLDNIIRAVNPGNGNQKWKKETGTRPVLPPLAFGGVVVLPGLMPAMTVFVAKTGALMGTYVAPSAPAPVQVAPIATISTATAVTPIGPAQTLLGPPLIDPALTPFKVSIVTITRDGLIEGLRSPGLLFREPANVAFGTTYPTLPGRPVMRESTPNPTTPNAQHTVSR
jgi:outer membrane protein assembly factor BamB